MPDKDAAKPPTGPGDSATPPRRSAASSGGAPLTLPPVSESPSTGTGPSGEANKPKGYPSPRKLDIGTVALVLGTWVLAVAAIWQAIQSQSQFIEQERPYLWVPNGAAIFHWPNDIGQSIQNFGQTPARDVRAAFYINFYWKGDPTPTRQRVEDTFATALAAPKEKWLYNAIIPPSGVEHYIGRRQFDRETSEYLKYTEWSWVSAGRVTYSDASGRKYYSDLCFRAGGADNGIGTPCPTHNEAH